MLNLRIANKTPVLSFYYRSQVHVFLIVKVEVIFSPKNHFSCQFCFKLNGNLFSFAHIWPPSGSPVAES